MVNKNLTEADVMSKLIARAKDEDEVSPRAIVIARLQAPNSATRTVKIALIVAINNESLVDALIDECILNDMNFYFIGSEAQLQGEMEVDYLMFEAKIMVKRP